MEPVSQRPDGMLFLTGMQMTDDVSCSEKSGKWQGKCCAVGEDDPAPTFTMRAWERSLAQEKVSLKME